MMGEALQELMHLYNSESCQQMWEEVNTPACVNQVEIDEVDLIQDGGGGGNISEEGGGSAEDMSKLQCRKHNECTGVNNQCPASDSAMSGGRWSDEDNLKATDNEQWMQCIMKSCTIRSSSWWKYTKDNDTRVVGGIAYCWCPECNEGRSTKHNNNFMSNLTSI